MEISSRQSRVSAGQRLDSARRTLVRMPPPSTLWYVEWDAARRRDTPHDRRRVRRTYTSPHDAARQLATLLHNAHYGSHLQIVGVWIVVGHDAQGLEWQPFFGPAHLQHTVVPAWDDEPSGA